MIQNITKPNTDKINTAMENYAKIAELIKPFEPPKYSSVNEYDKKWQTQDISNMIYKD